MSFYDNDRHDRWKDNYDAWKLASPYDEYEECYHDDYDIDLEGRAHCSTCNETWWPSVAEMKHLRHLDEQYDKHCRREERREFWRNLRRKPIDWTYPIRFRLYRLLERIWSRKSCWPLTDDEIPF